MKARQRIVLFALCLLMAFTLSSCSQDKSSAYNKALTIFATGDYLASSEAFDKIGDYSNAATYAAYSHGMVLYEQERYDEAEPYFALARDFMYGDERYKFCHAYVLEAEGKYDEAAAIYLELGEYESAAARYAYANARVSETNADYLTALYGYQIAGEYSDASERLYLLQMQIYKHAGEVKEEGLYDQAMVFYGYLGDFLDCEAQAKECKDFYRDQLYKQAEAILASGDLQAAYDAFNGLVGYSDSAQRADDLAILLGIETADESN